MPSRSRQELSTRLTDFDELIEARDAICPDGAGRPAKRRGAAVVRSSVVLLAASFEAYVEEVYESAVDLLFAAAPPADRKKLKDDTSGRLNNATVFKVNRLFFNIGIPWIMHNQRVRWQKFTNQSVRDALDGMVNARNSIAHGEVISVRKPTAVRWRGFVERLADRIDSIVGDHVHQQTGIAHW